MATIPDFTSIGWQVLTLRKKPILRTHLASARQEIRNDLIAVGARQNERTDPDEASSR